MSRDPYLTEKAAKFKRDRERALAQLRAAAESIERARQIIEWSTGERELEPGRWPDWQTAALQALNAAEAAHDAARPRLHAMTREGTPIACVITTPYR
jgi:hypothetical protein